MRREKNMGVKYLTIVSVALACILTCYGAEAAPPSDGITRSPPEAPVVAILKYLRPSLSESGKVGRIYYPATCQSEGFDKVLFPETAVQAPPDGESDLAAAQQMFRNNGSVGVTQDQPGIVRIRIGNIPDDILQTKISRISFTPDEQYNVLAAFSAIYENEDVSASMRNFGVRPTQILTIYAMNPAIEDLPHLPSTMTNVTVDQVLDKIAKTFNGVVFYGACTQQHKIDIYFAHLADYNPAPPGERNPH
jgi:hypothetical protein